MFGVWSHVRTWGLFLSLPGAFLLAKTVSFAAPAQSGQPKKPPVEAYQLQPGDDVPQPPSPVKTRTPAEQARVDAMAWYTTGQFRQARNDFQGALDAYREAVKLDPNAIQVYRALIPLAISLNHIDEAVQHSLKAAELDPDNYRLLFTLAIRMAENGKVPEAVQLLEKATQSATLKKDSSIYVILMSELARFHSATGQPAKAADCYEVVFDALVNPDKYKLDFRTRRVLQTDPATTFQKIGEAFLAAKRPKLAIQAFEQAAKARKGRPGTLSYDLARVYLQTDQPDKALTELQKYFDAQLQSKGKDAYRLLADVLEKAGKSDELIGRLEELAKQDTRNSTLQYFLAGQYAAKNRLDEAETLYKKTLAASGDVEGFAGLAVVYRRQKRPEELLVALSKAMKNVVDALLIARMKGEPEDENPHLKRFEEELKPLREDEKLFDGVLAAGRKLAEGDQPQLDFTGSYILATLAAEARKTDAALQFYRFAIKARRDRAQLMYVELGIHLLVVRNFAEAVNVFRDAAGDPALADSKPNNLYMLSRALELNNDTDAALQAIGEARKSLEAVQQAHGITPGSAASNVRLYFHEGWIYYHSRRWDKATPVFEQLIAKHEQTKDEGIKEIVRQSQFVLSNIFVQQGDMRKGEQILEEVLAEEPDNISVNNDLGYLYADQGKHLDKAEKMIRKALKAEPENSAYLDSMGWVLFKLGKFDEALKYLEEAAAKAEEVDATIFDHLGDCYDRLQKPQKAKEHWQRALEKGKQETHPDKKLLEKIEQKLKKGAGSAKPDTQS